MNPLDGRLGPLVGQLLADLCEALSPDLQAKLVLYRAACELLVEDLQPRDRGALCYATSHLALQALGVTDAAVERVKVQLATGRDPETLDWRH